MDNKIFNVDEFLTNNAITIVLAGKEYVVTDVPYTFHDKIKGDDTDRHKEAIAELLGCKKEVLQPYGMAATNAIIDRIIKSLFPKSSQEIA